MPNNFPSLKPQTALIFAQFNSPDITYEELYRETVKCAAIVEQPDGNFPFEALAYFSVNPVLGKILWYQINTSNTFCAGLSSWLFQQLRLLEEKQVSADGQKGGLHSMQLELGRGCSVHIQGKTKKNSSGAGKIISYIDIQPMIFLSLESDLKWSKLLLVGLVEYMQLQDVMAWLSTLGGAYSAMGEHLHSYSEKAGQISHHQLLVAIRLGNPILAAQSKVFAALSLIQRGRLKLASRIIRDQYRLAASDGFAKDGKLISSCRAAWCRIQFLRKQRKMNKPAHNMTTG